MHHCRPVQLVGVHGDGSGRQRCGHRPAVTAVGAGHSCTVAGPTNQCGWGRRRCSVVAVSWTPSDENRGPPVRRFTATADPGGAQCTVNAPATTCTVTGLVNQTAYRFSVVATNNTGNGPPSVSTGPPPRSPWRSTRTAVPARGPAHRRAMPSGHRTRPAGVGSNACHVTLGQVMIATTPPARVPGPGLVVS